MQFMRDALAGKKQLIKCHDVRNINLPRYKEFHCGILYKAAMDDPLLSRYLPDPNDNSKNPVSRRFLLNVSDSYWIPRGRPSVSGAVYNPALVGDRDGETRRTRPRPSISPACKARTRTAAAQSIHRHRLADADAHPREPARLER